MDLYLYKILLKEYVSRHVKHVNNVPIIMAQVNQMDAGQLSELLRAAITGFYIQVAKPQCPDCTCSPVITCGSPSESSIITGVNSNPCYNSWWFCAGIAFIVVFEID